RSVCYLAGSPFTTSFRIAHTGPDGLPGGSQLQVDLVDNIAAGDAHLEREGVNPPRLIRRELVYAIKNVGVVELNLHDAADRAGDDCAGHRAIPPRLLVRGTPRCPQRAAAD